MVGYERGTATLAVYIRQAAPGVYPDGLARSIHFAVSRDGSNYEAWNSGYGILFAQGTITEQNTICPKCVSHPSVTRRPDGTYAITAQRVEEDGSVDQESQGKVLLWLTKDFIHFTECGLVEEKEGRAAEAGEGTDGGNRASCEKRASCGEGRPAPDALEVSVCAVPGAVCDRASVYWGKLYNTQIRLPDQVCVSDARELAGVKAEAVYSDGSRVEKPVDWDLSGADFSKEGEYTVRGQVRSPYYPFPLDTGWGDPVILPWEGKYYYIATNDNLNDVGFYVREADRPEELFADGIEQHVILDYDEEREFIQTFWAPEFHVIGGRLYILFAVGPKEWGPQCHLMRLKEGGRITDPDAWEEPVKILKKDGTVLCEKGISLDMTYIRGEERSYVTWSYREHIGKPLDTGSMLYIAEIDEKTPWILKSDPVLLTRPLYGWENTEGTINNEGPHAFVADGTVYLTYSGGAANGYTYVVGLLCADASADLLDLANWKKSQTPVLSFYSVEGVYGPGHNSFFVDPDGNLMIAYHGETAIDKKLRCPGIHRVHFDLQGRPRFDLSPARDLKEGLKNVTLRVTVKKG